MSTRIDADTAANFLLALARMITIPPQPGSVPNPRAVTFSHALAGEEHGFEQASLDVGMDIICVAFEPGREQDGPVNIAICEEREGELTTWPNCSPWAFSNEGPFLLVADGEDVGFPMTAGRSS